MAKAGVWRREMIENKQKHSGGRCDKQADSGGPGCSRYDRQRQAKGARYAMDSG